MCCQSIRNECNHYIAQTIEISVIVCVQCVYKCVCVCVILKTIRLKLFHTKPQSKCSCCNEWILLEWIRQRHNTSQYKTMPLRTSACTQYTFTISMRFARSLNPSSHSPTLWVVLSFFANVYIYSFIKSIQFASRKYSAVYLYSTFYSFFNYSFYGWSVKKYVRKNIWNVCMQFYINNHSDQFTE